MLLEIFEKAINRNAKPCSTRQPSFVLELVHFGRALFDGVACS